LNYSFEQFDSCTNYTDNLPIALFWQRSNISSPDYFNPCNTGLVSVPANKVGYQYAEDGDAYAGFGFAADLYPTREGITGKFSEQLKANQNYCFGFYLSVADSSEYVVDNIGVYLSSDTIIYTDYAFNNFPLTPQVNIDLSGFSDTSGWRYFEGNYIANGTEEYFIITNFQTNPTWTKINDSINKPFQIVYYYIDNVSIIECPNPVLPIRIPDVFTPNDDGINDTFTIQNLPPNSLLKIYNRWGFVVHETSDYHNDWNGTTAGGQKVSDGTYFYYLQTPDGKKYSGTLNVFAAH
jgi:gliding motility-associated-like protein